MMRAFAAWLMASRLNAIVGAAALGGLRLLDLLSGAVVALTTLVQGPLEGLRVAAVATALVGLGALVFGVQIELVLLPLAAAWVPALLLGSALRVTGSLAAALQTGAGVAVGTLLAFHLLHPEPVEAWRALIETIVAMFRDVRGTRFVAPEAAQLDAMARLAGGMIAAVALLSASLSLLLARWWQSLLTNPGGFAREFRGFRNGRAMTAAASLVFVAALFAESVLLDNMALVVLVPFLLQGIGVAHRIVAQRELGVGWLVAMYALTVLLPLHMWALFAGLGFADNWWDIEAGARPRNGT